MAAARGWIAATGAVLAVFNSVAASAETIDQIYEAAKGIRPTPSIS